MGALYLDSGLCDENWRGVRDTVNVHTCLACDGDWQREPRAIFRELLLEGAGGDEADAGGVGRRALLRRPEIRTRLPVRGASVIACVCPGVRASLCACVIACVCPGVRASLCACVTACVRHCVRARAFCGMVGWWWVGQGARNQPSVQACVQLPRVCNWGFFKSDVLCGSQNVCRDAPRAERPFTCAET